MTMFEQPVFQLVAIVCMGIVALRVLNYFRLVWGVLLSVAILFAAIIYLPMAWGGWGVTAIVPLSFGLIYLAMTLTKYRNRHR
jgi:hypothetical protein